MIVEFFVSSHTHRLATTGNVIWVGRGLLVEKRPLARGVCHVNVLLKVVVRFGLHHLLEEALSFDQLRRSFRLELLLGLELLNVFLGLNMRMHSLFDVRNVELCLLNHVRSMLLLALLLFILFRVLRFPLSLLLLLEFLLLLLDVFCHNLVPL